MIEPNDKTTEKDQKRSLQVEWKRPHKPRDSYRDRGGELVAMTNDDDDNDGSREATAKILLASPLPPPGHVSVGCLFIPKAGAKQPWFDVLGHCLTSTNIISMSPGSERIQLAGEF
jgi:hypothetical protein